MKAGVRGASRQAHRVAAVWSRPAKRLDLLQTILALDSRLLVTQDVSGRLIALEPDTGRTVWTYPWRCDHCVVSDGTAYAWFGGGDVHLVEVATGRPRMCFPCPPATTAIVDGSDLFVQWSTRAAGWSVVCYDVRTGLEQWAHDASEPLRGNGGPLILVDGAVVVGDGSQDLCALARDSGVILWRSSLAPGAMPGSRALLAASRTPTHVVFTLNDGLACVSARGTLDWQASGGRAATDESRSAFFVNKRALCTITVEDGRQVARVTITSPIELGWQPGVRAVTADHAIVTTEAGALLAIAKRSGHVDWLHHPADPGPVSHVITDGRRFYYSSGWTVHAVEPPIPAAPTRRRS